MNFGSKMQVPSVESALPGRPETMPVPPSHFVLGHPLVGPFPSHMKMVQFGMGCFWGRSDASGKWKGYIPPPQGIRAG